MRLVIDGDVRFIVLVDIVWFDVKVDVGEGERKRILGKGDNINNKEKKRGGMFFLLGMVENIYYVCL